MPACQSLEQTTAFITKRRPALINVLETFLPLLQARENTAAELAAPLAVADIALPQFNADSSGEPILVGASLRGIGAIIGVAAARLLPMLLEQSALTPHHHALESLFLRQPTGNVDLREQLISAMAAVEPEAFLSLAQKADIPPEILDFTASFIVSAVLRALVAHALTGREEAPWDVEGAWQHGYCPVCGSSPVISWLDMRSFDEKNAFLSGGGGKKHFHCALCGANWKFRRGVCPACGKEGDGGISILKEQGAYGERIDFCNHCRTYSPTVDLRELEKIPNMDAMALGMIHLDIAAAERDLKPLKPSFWNMF